MIKKRIFTILMSLAMVITMMPMMAATAFAGEGSTKGMDFTVGNLSYTVISNDNTVVVRKADNLKASELTGTVIIPEKVCFEGDKYSVVEVQDFAFKNCKNIKSMVLGVSKKVHLKIGRQAFRNCTGLRNFTTGTCNLEFVKINGCTDAFEGVGTESNPCWFNKIDTGRYAGMGGDMQWSNMIFTALGVASATSDDGWIGRELNPKTTAFENSGAYFVCTNLYSLYTSEEHNQELWSVCIPNAESSADADDTYTLVYGGYGEGIKGTEGKYYFKDYAKINKVIIPESLSIKGIGDKAFTGLGSECGIDEIVLPSTVNQIADGAFQGSGVKSVVFGKNLSSMGNYVFAECSKLQKVTFKSTPFFSDTEKGLGSETFAAMKSTPTLVLPLNWSAEKYNSTNWYGGKFKQYINPAKRPKVTVKKYKKSFKLSWKKVSGARYYVVQTAKKGKTLKTVVKTTKKTYTVKKVAGKSLKKGKKYSMRVLAYDYYGNLIGRGYTLTRKK